jgi:cytoskeletal protein RodZ
MEDIMAEVRETHAERRRGRGGLFLVTFLVGGFLIGVVAVMLMNVQGTLYWPAGRVDFNLRPTASTASTAPTTATAEATTTATTASAPSESTDTTVTPDRSTAPSDANPSALTAPAETQPQ